MVMIKTPANSEKYAEAFQSSTIECFWKIVNN